MHILCARPFILGVINLPVNKPFKTIEEQIDILKSRNLLFLNPTTAQQSLKSNGYYEIINGYKYHFLKDSRDDSKGYKDGINFEHIYALYELDRNIRQFTMTCLEDFEQTFKQNLAYVISQSISEKQQLYTAKSHYNTGESHKTKYGKKFTDRDKLLRQFNFTITSDFDPYKHYRKKHGNVPPWIMAKNFTFGNVIYWFQLSKKNIREQVIARMLGIDVDVIEASDKILKITSAFNDLLILYLDYRNLCAHEGRIFNHRTKAHQIRNYSPFIYRQKILDTTISSFKKGVKRSSLGTVLKSLKIFTDFPQIDNCEAWVKVFIQEYLKNYPEDIDYLRKETELDIVIDNINK